VRGKFKEKAMKLRYFTEDDYVNGIPCIHKYRDSMETVFPIQMSGKHSFDGGRELTVKASNGHVSTHTIGGSDLTQVLYASS
jgi:hypothetical protein